jgi:hypothetical protein
MGKIATELNGVVYFRIKVDRWLDNFHGDLDLDLKK